MRLDNFVVNALQVSRNDARKIIKSESIICNGIIRTKNDFSVSESDDIFYNDQKLIYKQWVYLMLNKPQGYICANKDNLHKVVFDLIKGYDVSKLCIVGRLDIDTEGFVLITNDGKLAHKLTSPKNKCLKKYYVETDGKFTNEQVKLFEKGIEIYESVDVKYLCQPAKLEIIDYNKAYITISEGKYHQVKKMCKAIGNTVTYLKRISIGNIVIDDNLPLGSYRELTNEEEIKLKE